MHTLSVLGYLAKNKKYQQNCMVIGNDSKLKLNKNEVCIMKINQRQGIMLNVFNLIKYLFDLEFIFEFMSHIGF